MIRKLKVTETGIMEDFILEQGTSCLIDFQKIERISHTKYKITTWDSYDGIEFFADEVIKTKKELLASLGAINKINGFEVSRLTDRTYNVDGNAYTEKELLELISDKNAQDRKTKAFILSEYKAFKQEPKTSNFKFDDWSYFLPLEQFQTSLHGELFEKLKEKYLSQEEFEKDGFEKYLF